jgi:hypothetical protein
MNRRVAIFRYGAWNFAFFPMLIALILSSSGLDATDLSVCVSSENRELDYRLGSQKSIESISGLVFTERQFRRIFLAVLPTNRSSLELARTGIPGGRSSPQRLRCGFGELHDVH